MPLFRALLCATVLTIGCSDPPGSGTPTDGGTAPAADASPGPGTGACPLTLTDGTTYNAVSCDVSGVKSFASGVYQIQISARFNTNQPIRSVSFTINDKDLPTETHVKTFPVGTDNPGVNSTYSVTFMDMWGTLDQTVVVGSGAFVVTEYDRAGKLISGTYDIVVKQGAASKTITGTLTRVPMKQAD